MGLAWWVKRDQEAQKDLAGEKAKAAFCRQFKEHLRNARKVRVSLPTAFAIVWNHMSQTVGLPEKDSREVYRDLITWVKARQRRFDQDEAEQKFAKDAKIRNF